MTTEELIKRFYEEAQDDTESMYWIAADRIEQLEAEVDLLKSDFNRDTVGQIIAALQLANEQKDAEIERKISASNYVLEQLAAHEATIKTLREALIKCRAHIGDPANFDCYGTDRELAEFLQQVKRDEDSAIECADIALSLPAPTDHLMAYRDEVLEEAAKVCEDSSVDCVADICARKVRAMKETK